MILISRVPLRVSFFGGGTDYPCFLQHADGAVIGATIDKYIYIVGTDLATFAEQKYRITYRQVESVQSVEEIRHPVVRAVLTKYQYDRPLNLAILSDLPGGTGLGSSSAFTVGLIRLIHALKGNDPTRHDLAREAIHVEQDVLRENVGIQDQLHAAFGGLSHYALSRDSFSITPLGITNACRNALNDGMVLVYTGVERVASQVVEEQVKATASRCIDRELESLLDVVRRGREAFLLGDPNLMLAETGRLLNEAWQIKRGLANAVSNSRIDEMYYTGMKLGAFGGKLCGAGGGGFLLFLSTCRVREMIVEAFGPSCCVPIRIENEGVTLHRA